ncbi:Steadiness box [Heracleum sosnowskyi]|uniref:Steadiness box n=1 Tax=Heracleum sosnowskyi TaxID=360622 RepID=A0AAD8M1P8_9APIA|nr:Steadiness box [Heracleum sosnowskyi]
MTSPATSPSPNTQQFLSSVLSQRGPSSLPYSEDCKWLIRQHLVSLADSYPSLQPKTATFTHNDGRTVNLLQAEGTVPMMFQNITYNIPIVIWLMESYPRHSPIVFVNPTRDMIIKRPHPFVNPSGMVSIPYLQNWIYPSSNLLELCGNLSHYFGSNPPLYSQRRPVQNVSPSPSVSPSMSPSVSFDSSSGVAAARPAIPPGTYPPSPYSSGGRMQFPVPTQPAPPQRISEDAGEVFRRNAINKLVENLHGDIGVMRKSKEAEMEGLFGVQGTLRQRAEHISKGVREMEGEKEGLELQLQMVSMNTDVLEGWLRENEGKKKDGVGIDDAFVPVDNFSKQILECTSADLAIEDVVYALDKAVQDGSIPFDQYLRTIRSLSREQFFHRATALKVRGVQNQAHVSSMAARASPYLA